MAGALCGGIAAVVGIVIASLLIAHEMVTPAGIALAGVFGAALGALLLPPAAWLLMRRVPLMRSFLGTTVGATAGGVLGTAAELSSHHLALALPGAIAGFAAAFVVLRLRYATREEKAVPLRCVPE